MKFKNKVTGIIEDVTNASLIPQYQKHSDTYEQVKKVEPKSTKTTKSK